jgi:hypothetical protein
MIMIVGLKIVKDSCEDQLLGMSLSRDLMKILSIHLFPVRLEKLLFAT